MMMNALLVTYTDLVLSLNLGTIKGKNAVSKPLYLLSIIEAIEWGELKENEICLDNQFLRKRFGQLYEQINNNSKGYESSFFVRPFFHLSSSSFYELVWKPNSEKPNNSTTPSAKYLRENLLYAKLDDELWDLLQDAESRDYLKRSIIKRYLTK